MASTIDDSAFSLRLKYGVHTIMLFVDSLQPFSEISATLLAILRERFPDGLTISHNGPDTTPLPSPDDDVRVAYALPINAADLSQGWKDLEITGEESPVQKGLKDNYPVAFVLLTGDEEVEFVVDVPDLDEAYEEEP